jgi:hypothetical protein
MAVISKLLPVAAVLFGCVNPATALAVPETAERWDVHYHVGLGSRLTSRGLAPM